MEEFAVGRKVAIWPRFMSRNGTAPKHPAVERNFGLDLMRSIAIILVLIAHSLYMYYDKLPALIGNNLLLVGDWGVQMFFVLSGFLIGSIMIKEISQKGFNRSVVFNFLKRRWFRTLPNYYLFLTLYTILAIYTPHTYLAAKYLKGVLTVNNPLELIYFPFFIQTFRATDISFFGHSWSLAVEEWFYLTLPAMLWITSLFFKRKENKLKSWIAATIVTMTIVFMCLRFAGIAEVFGQYYKLSLIYNLDNIMIGVGLAWVMRYYKVQLLKNKNVLLFTGMALFLIGMFLDNKLVLIGHPRMVWQGIVIPMQALSFAAGLPWFYSLKLKRKTWASRLITEISITSYSIYLVHLLVLIFVIDGVVAKFSITSALGLVSMVVLFIAISLVVASLNYHLFEKRMTALRDKFSAK